MNITWLYASVCFLAPLAAMAQEPYKAVILNEPPPAGLAAPVREVLSSKGLRVLTGEGQPFAEIWLRKAAPATAKPSGPKGSVLFPVLAEGELLGAFRFVSEGHDYRDQAIAPGVYTLRYGLQPVNGDHLGVSAYRDYALLCAAAKDQTVNNVPQKQLETKSAEAAGSNHPAVMILLAAPENSKGESEMVHDESKNTWGAIVSLPLTVKGDSGPTPLRLQLVVVGAAMN
jgi:hypothetical protein